MIISAFIPLAPMPCPRPRFGRGHTYNEDSYKDWKNAVALHLKQRMEYPAPKKRPLVVTLEFRIERPKSNKGAWPTGRPDLDNYVKAVLDAGNGILWHDDSQAVRIIAEKSWASVPSTIAVMKNQGVRMNGPGFAIVAGLL